MTEQKEVSPKTLYMRKWRAEHPEYKSYMKKYRKDNRIKINEQDTKWRHTHPEQVREWNKRYKDNHKHIKNAQQLAERNIPLGDKCELCPEDDIHTENLERHHPDYDYPLIIITVCKECHSYITNSKEDN